MKLFHTLLFALCVCWSHAQRPSLVEALYAEQWSIDTLTRQRGYDTVVLRIKGEKSSYWSRNQFFRDSLLALPDGRQQFMRLATQLVAKNGPDKLYSNLGEYIYRSGDTTRTRTTLRLGTSNEPVELVEPTEIPQWRLLDSCRTIEAHVCFLAETDFRGRHWIAWYAPEVPLAQGPWKLCGLPGLIFEAYDRTDDYHYTLVRLTSPEDTEIAVLNLRNYRYRSMDRLEYLRKMADYMRLATSEQIRLSTGNNELAELFPSDKPAVRRDFRERDYTRKPKPEPVRSQTKPTCGEP